MKSASQLRLEEFQVQGRPGFRRLPKKARESKISKIKQEYILDDFRRIQIQVTKNKNVIDSNSTVQSSVENVSGNHTFNGSEILEGEDEIKEGNMIYPTPTITPQKEKLILEKWSNDIPEELSSAGIFLQQDLFNNGGGTECFPFSEIMYSDKIGKGEEEANEIISIIDEWDADESGYDEETWPQLKEALEKNRDSNRRLFNG